MSIKFEKWDKTWDIWFEISSYNYGGGLAIEMICEEEYGPEPFATLTVNLEDFPTEGNNAFVDINNLSDEIVDWLIANNLGEMTGRIGFSGFCAYPEIAFNLDEIKKHVKE